jgi:hypothetical protein
LASPGLCTHFRADPLSGNIARGEDGAYGGAAFFREGAEEQAAKYFARGALDDGQSELADELPRAGRLTPSRPASSNRLFSIKHFSLAREYDVTGLFHSLCFLAIFLRNQYTQVS